MRPEPRTSTATKAALLALFALAACGGGGGGGDDGAASPPPPPPPPAAGAVTTDAQAKIIAARSADALFAYDNLNSTVVYAALSPLNGGVAPLATQRSRAMNFRVRPHIPGNDGPGTNGPLADASYPVGCDSGSATSAFSDADNDGWLSPGDSITLAATGCVFELGGPWPLGGSMRVDITAGSNVHEHWWALAQGAMTMLVTHAGTAIGGGRTATGTYRIAVSNTAAGEWTTQVITIADLNISHANADVRLRNISFTVPESVRMESATGRIETRVEGVGDVALTISVKTTLAIDSTTPRFRPTAGTLTFTATDFAFDVTYGAGEAVTIRVDNGKDGSVDRTVTTTVGELDSLLTAK